MEHIVLGLGSNRSYGGKSPVQLLSSACKSISSFVSGMQVSSVYRTGAMYVEDQEDFYNMVIAGDFDGSPRQLLDAIHGVEQAHGRDRSQEFRNGPRSLDVDIELFGALDLNEPDLIIPHERMTERAFVLVPFLEVLNENADVNSTGIDFYTARLSQVSDQKIQLFMDKREFLSLS